MMALVGSVAVAGVEASRLRGSPREWGRIRLSYSFYIPKKNGQRMTIAIINPIK